MRLPMPWSFTKWCSVVRQQQLSASHNPYKDLISPKSFSIFSLDIFQLRFSWKLWNGRASLSLLCRYGWHTSRENICVFWAAVADTASYIDNVPNIDVPWTITFLLFLLYPFATKFGFAFSEIVPNFSSIKTKRSPPTLASFAFFSYGHFPKFVGAAFYHFRLFISQNIVL